MPLTAISGGTLQHMKSRTHYGGANFWKSDRHKLTSLSLPLSISVSISCPLAHSQICACRRWSSVFCANYINYITVHIFNAVESEGDIFVRVQMETGQRPFFLLAACDSSHTLKVRGPRSS